MTAFAPAGAADVQGKFHVFEGGEKGYQTEGLEDKGDSRTAQLHKLGLGELTQVTALEDYAPVVGLVQPSQQVKQGGLAGTGTAGNGQKLAGHDVQIDAVDGVHRLVAGAGKP